MTAEVIVPKLYIKQTNKQTKTMNCVSMDLSNLYPCKSLPYYKSITC